MLISNINDKWDTTILINNEEDAINISKKYPHLQVQIFSKTLDGYKPTYCFYKNGKLIES